MEKYKVALADDHVLIRKGLVSLIHSFDDYTVLFQSRNGQELMEQLDPGCQPDVVLLDINMPKKDGYETALWLKINFPDIKVLALSMYDTEGAIIRMLKNGARGFIFKDAEPQELKQALDSLIRKGYHYSELVTGHLIHNINQSDSNTPVNSLLQLTEREMDFLKYACTELSYKEISEKMFVSPRTVEGYRDALCEKLKLRTRIGLAIYALKYGIVDLSNIDI
jgi:two-component system invasion response regulator UvrY